MLREPQIASVQSTPAFVPAADILEAAGGFELHLALPGVKKEAVTIEFLDGQLVISGERPNTATASESAAVGNGNDAYKPEPKESATPAVPKFRRLETNYGRFSRSFRLPDTVSVKAIAAELTDGILRVTLPFDTEKITKQHIEIQ
ncbi:Hsp20/alpha crystallin family protein [Hymenobacter sp. BT683]|uniref:Hsp20/alpha crystallin family protein n=1 Tax=Hymenobacter jeongseonensis TaxID=2791027 RepID=A0ABS0IK10_9BACT|nr:Hsp20/alpha crystallin family protein [Hymenobacter jeongseonensis]MBF9238710.1 Hsp20/alpha crystallin family protein [Hymenobacter jeongseonensis]